MRKTGVTLLCAVCNEPFYVPAYRKSTAKFCSRLCAAHVQLAAIRHKANAASKGRKPPNFAGTSIVCEQCGTRFFVPPSRLRSKRFCSQSCFSTTQRGGVTPPVESKDRYVRITVDGKRMLEHRWIMEQHLGRRLLPSEQVDHINRVRSDNRIENLRVLDIREHGRVSSYQRHIFTSRLVHHQK